MIGDLICSYRDEKNMTQEELALKACIGKEYLIKIESNEIQASPHTLLSLSGALDIPIATLEERLNNQ